MTEFEDHMIRLVCDMVGAGTVTCSLEELYLNASMLIYGNDTKVAFIREEVERRLKCDQTNGN